MGDEVFERYWLEGQFGTRSASNNTSACKDCGAVVYSTEIHDRWHAEQAPLIAVIGSMPSITQDEFRRKYGLPPYGESE